MCVKICADVHPSGTGTLELMQGIVCRQTLYCQAEPYERVWKSDSLIPSSLQDEPIAVTPLLKNVPDAMKTPTASLKGATIQCITKLANIVLTSEQPEYPCGKWCVDGYG